MVDPLLFILLSAWLAGVVCGLGVGLVVKSHYLST